MDKLKIHSENNHKELLVLINPLIDFMRKNGYSYFLVAGKEGICTRHLNGHFDDVTGMIIGMIIGNKEVEGIIKYSSEHSK